MKKFWRIGILLGLLLTSWSNVNFAAIVTITSTPEGASVYVQRGTKAQNWISFGVTPTTVNIKENCQIHLSFSRLKEIKAEKKGRRWTTREYANWLKDLHGNRAISITKMLESLIRQLESNPNLFFDESWKNKVISESYQHKALYREVKNARPPVDCAESHYYVLKAWGHYDKAADLRIKSVRDLDAASAEESTKEMILGTFEYTDI